MVRNVALIQPGQKKRRHCRGTRVLRVSVNREVQCGVLKQPWRGVVASPPQNPQNIRPKQVTSYGGFGQHVERTEITKVLEKFLPTIFYNGFSWMCRKSQ